MIVTDRYNQSRRDLSIDMECEVCAAKFTYDSAYDDQNFWDNVIPDWKCEFCGLATNDLDNPIKQHIHTRYPEGFQV